MHLYIEGMDAQTELKGFMSLRGLFEFLESNPNRTRLVTRIYELGDISFISCFTHLNLLTLWIAADDMDPILMALSNLRLPRLLCLRLIYPNSTPPAGILPKSSLVKFVVQSGAKLHSLRIRGSIYNPQAGPSKGDQVEIVTTLEYLRTLFLDNGVEDVVDAGVSKVLRMRWDVAEKIGRGKLWMYVLPLPKPTIAVIHGTTPVLADQLPT